MANNAICGILHFVRRVMSQFVQRREERYQWVAEGGVGCCNVAHPPTLKGVINCIMSQCAQQYPAYHLGWSHDKSHD